MFWPQSLPMSKTWGLGMVVRLFIKRLRLLVRCTCGEGVSPNDGRKPLASEPEEGGRCFGNMEAQTLNLYSHPFGGLGKGFLFS
jgi:hypothetical protein